LTKTYNNLLPQIYAFESLYKAYRKARLGKRGRTAVMKFEQNLEGNLLQLQQQLIDGTYQTGRYHRFSIFEPKEREAASLPFRDRVLQHSLCAAIEPIWENRFISDSYACRPGRGMHRGADNTQLMLQKVQREHGHIFVLKADVSKYFANIDHGVLKRLLRRHIACPQTLALCDHILASSINHVIPVSKGLPIGNLTSQLWANIYLNALDQYVKHELKCRYYSRYMDDFVIAHPDKQKLQTIKLKIEYFLNQTLCLKTNSKTQIFPVALKNGRGLDFLGYHLWPTHRRLRKASISRIAKTLKRLQKEYSTGKIGLKDIRQSLISWIAHASHCQSYGLRDKLLNAFIFARK